MKLWRCTYCGTEFEADKPACATCELHPAKDARHARFFHELVVVHFDPPTKWQGIGKGFLACASTVRVGTRGAHATGEPSAVTCKRCRATPEWITADNGPAIVQADKDYAVDVTPDGIKPKG